MATNEPTNLPTYSAPLNDQTAAANRCPKCDYVLTLWDKKCGGNKRLSQDSPISVPCAWIPRHARASAANGQGSGNEGTTSASATAGGT
ncbi:hypothetical protein F52700_2355 [Fusarium sp. NRRL 52700]|nr:hypothetical protein F52700_2355 [Fusarium sp. NRRL 52700]